MSFDFKKFADLIENGLKGNCVAYAFVVSYKDGWREKRAGGKARTTHNPPALNMSTDTRFHMASVSKAITGAALVRALYYKEGVSLGSPFYKLLPDHWHVHESVKGVTYQQLLTHMSGFRFSGDGLTYASLKENIAKGIDTSLINHYSYQGENFAVMRILIPRLAGVAIPQSAHTDSNFETIQASLYATACIGYVNKHLFGPSGLPELGCNPLPFINGMCYHFPEHGKAGTDFSDQTLVVGSKGWVMSAAELGRFFRTLHFTDKILPFEWSKEMKDLSLGYDAYGTTAKGMGCYWKGGWFPGAQNAGELNTMIVGYESGIQVAMIINSELAGGKSMGEIISGAHDACYVRVLKIKDK
ncbi:MAG: serine hydrolase [Chitinophagaceae bacterium]